MAERGNGAHVWSDTVQQAERLHLLRLCIWGALSTLAGTTLVVIAQRQQRVTGLILWFGVVCALFGTIELVVGALLYRTVPLRDLSGATRLDRFAWLQLGLYMGLSAVGTTLALVAARARPHAKEPEASLSTVGTGIAITLQGLALTTLQLFLIADISR